MPQTITPRDRVLSAIMEYGIAKAALEDANEAFGKHFRKERKKRSMSLRDVAKKTGFTAGYISDVELGRRNANKVLLDLFK